MILSVRDAKPEGIAFVDAYTAIRSWYSYNAHLPSAATSRSLISALPPSAEVSPVECKAVFSEVILGGLEWGEVRPRIERALAHLREVDIRLYEPAESSTVERA